MREQRGRGREISLSQAPDRRLEAPLREPTLGYLRTDVKQGVRSLREQLDPEDQLLLVLRVRPGSVPRARACDGVTSRLGPASESACLDGGRQPVTDS